jgi:hypothetical protein
VTVLTTTPHFNVDAEQRRQQPLIPKKGKWLFYSEIDGIPVWHIAMRQKSADSSARMQQMILFHWGALRFFLQDAEKYDILLSPSPPLTIGAVSWLMAKWCKAKSIYNVQELYPDFAIEQGDQESFNMGPRKLEAFVYARNDRSRSVISSGRSCLGVLRSKVITIPNFVDVELYRSSEQSLRPRATTRWTVRGYVCRQHWAGATWTHA